jgi:hypothetical protein
MPATLGQDMGSSAPVKRGQKNISIKALRFCAKPFGLMKVRISQAY